MKIIGKDNIEIVDTIKKATTNAKSTKRERTNWDENKITNIGVGSSVGFLKPHVLLLLINSWTT